jgi:5-methylcytosine-specific restriction endonuclease McrA
VTRDTGFPAAIAEKIWRRDRGCCARCALGLLRYRRGVDWAIHHRSPRGIGGAGRKNEWKNLPSNGVCLCNGCHEWVEKHRDEAREQGWLVSRISVARPANIPIPHALLGLARLDDEGEWETAA